MKVPTAQSVRYMIPSRLSSHVVDVTVDSDGIFVWGDVYFYDPSSGSHTVHAESLSELRRMLSDVKIHRHAS